MSSAGDVNGDGFDDLIIGANGADPGGNNAAGESYVVFGRDFRFEANLRAASNGGPGGAAALTQLDADAITSAAIARWSATGLSDAQVAGLNALDVQIVDLSGNSLGAHTANGTVLLDVDAAGHGWFVDATPDVDGEFTYVGGTEFTSDAAGIDLLTVVMHEMGHALGLHDDAAGAPPNGLLAETLTTGTRRLPPGTDIDPLAAFGDQIIAQGSGGLTIALPSIDSAGNALEIQVQLAADPKEALRLDLEHGLFASDRVLQGNYYENFRGQGEKYFPGQ